MIFQLILSILLQNGVFLEPENTNWKFRAFSIELQVLSLSINAFRSIGRDFQTLCWNLLYVSWTSKGIVESLTLNISSFAHFTKPLMNISGSQFFRPALRKSSWLAGKSFDCTSKGMLNNSQ